MAPPLNQSNWVYGISDLPMDNYTDDGTPPEELIKLVTADQQAAQIEVTPWTNEGESTGHDWATESETEKHDVNFAVNINPTIQMTERIVNGLIGPPITTEPTEGVTKNVHVPQDANTSRQLPVYWLSEQCGDAHNALYPSMAWTKGTFKGEEFGRLNFAGNLRGSGRQMLDEEFDLIPETNKKYAKNTQSKIVRATAATPGTPVKTYQCGLQSFMFDADNANDANVGYDPGCQRFYTANDEDSGVIRSYDIFGRRKYTGQFIIWLENSSVELALLRAQAALYLNTTMIGKVITSTYHNMIGFEMHLAKYRSVVLGNKNGFTTLEISPDAFYNESANKIISVTTQYATPA